MYCSKKIYSLQTSCGDIFQGAPAVDAIVRPQDVVQKTLTFSPCLQVSPANSFGFMDGGIDMVYSLHFGWDL